MSTPSGPGQPPGANPQGWFVPSTLFSTARRWVYLTTASARLRAFINNLIPAEVGDILIPLSALRDLLTLFESAAGMANVNRIPNPNAPLPVHPDTQVSLALVAHAIEQIGAHYGREANVRIDENVVLLHSVIQDLILGRTDT